MHGTFILELLGMIQDIFVLYDELASKWRSCLFCGLW